MDNINMKQLTTIQSIKFYTYKQLLYILIQFNIINYNQKNELLIAYYETQCNTYNSKISIKQYQYFYNVNTRQTG